MALADGWRFASLHASPGKAAPIVRTVLSSPSGELRHRDRRRQRAAACRRSSTSLPLRAGTSGRRTTSTACGFDGHEPLRPLVDHDGPTDRFTTPVRGIDPYEVAVGPIHAGVIESGHFRFHVVGDLILHVDARLFYKHRGLERAAEGCRSARPCRSLRAPARRCWVTNAVAYAQACEEALGLAPAPDLARARTILLELERVWNTLNDIAADLRRGGARRRHEPVCGPRRRRESA